MTTATQQVNIPTWKEVIGNALLVEYELKFDVNFSQRKQIFIFIAFPCACVFVESSVRVDKKHIELKFAIFRFMMSLLFCLPTPFLEIITFRS
jgi:hypothetical protein